MRQLADLEFDAGLVGLMITLTLTLIIEGK